MLKEPLRAIRVMFSLLWRAASWCLIWRSGSASCSWQTFALKNHSEDQHITPWDNFLLSSPCGVATLLFAPVRPRNRPRHVLLEVRKHKQNKGKSLKMINLWHLKTPTSSKSVQDYTQKWITQNHSIWPVAAHPQMMIYDRSNFCFKTTAAINILTF